MRFSLFFYGLLAAGSASFAQGDRQAMHGAGQGYDPHALFAPGFYSDKAQPFRSSNGGPAAKYWQNRADYTITARIDTISNELSGSEAIHYTNNSPDSLYSLWLQLDQNTYRKDARSNFYTEPASEAFSDGYELGSVSVQQSAIRQDEQADYIVTDTRLQIRLKKALAPGGGKLRILIRYNYIVPRTFGNRTDYAPTQNGKIYEIAQ